MSVAAQRDTLNSMKPNATNCMITEDPSLMFSIAKWHVTSVCQGLSSLAQWGGKMRNPGNKVETVLVLKKMHDEH